jgi:hypothetical protein
VVFLIYLMQAPLLLRYNWRLIACTTVLMLMLVLVLRLSPSAPVIVDREGMVSRRGSSD